MLHGLTRFQELSQKHRLSEAIGDLTSPIAAGDVLRVPLSVDHVALSAAVRAIEIRYEMRGFENSNGVDDSSYQNISLTHNPAIAGDPHHSTLGSSALARADFFYGNAKTASAMGSIKDSYYDTYGFRFPTSAALIELAPLFSKLKRSVVRSRLSIIRSGHPQPSSFRWGWHKDEPVFENLRVNIHVTDSDDHRIQIMSDDRMPSSQDDPCLTEHKFEVGFGYSWDTHLPHRACAVADSKRDRAAIVLGFSPWFDFDESSDEWKPNEFFGKKHPLQMLMDGDVI